MTLEDVVDRLLAVAEAHEDDQTVHAMLLAIEELINEIGEHA